MAAKAQNASTAVITEIVRPALANIVGKWLHQSRGASIGPKARGVPPTMPTPPAPLSSVCVYCASSNGADPAWLEEAAARLGDRPGRKPTLRLIYGGGGVGLMGACAGAARAAGGSGARDHAALPA